PSRTLPPLLPSPSPTQVVNVHPLLSIPLYALPIQLNLDRDALGPPPPRYCNCGWSNLLHAPTRLTLQVKVSTLREASLSSSLSPVSALCDMFNISRSVAVLRCLEVRGLRTHIEVLNLSRDITSASESRCQCPLAIRTTIALRRRDCSTRICA
ncbi:hypothetical protein C8R45DRAFT_949877, partial [Mycena sanguinolenta]